ncbi:MAG: glutamine synthetase III [Candidatus Adiutrix sp.]|jgi:glutamine synthetase|nr:glutamine synthetase III [Candidatus Adiutrix sp.]
MKNYSSPRLSALALIAKGHRRPDPKGAPDQSLFETFGQDVFSLRLMRERLPREVYNRIKNIGHNGQSLDPHDADVVASSMKDWAIDRQATHYTHWFQPMTGLTAEKHDAFLTPLNDGQVISEFSGKMLVKGEPDASSFPSGGLRSTFEARGYTAWDPTSPAFVLRHGDTATLCIPTVFYSYTGESLDRKTPLLRSIAALSRQATRMMNLLGHEDVSSVAPQVGAEQEYFLVDRRFYRFRPDLAIAGRTLFGACPAKGQQMEDHYFAAIPQRILAYMNDVEQRLFSLGVPVHTRHNEVAPCQYEMAPLYEPANVATDHNLLIMEVLTRTAEDHDLACLLHEKPFNCVNGSGKHSNWSLVDNLGRNLLDPGPRPWENLPFLMILAATLRAIHLYSPIWRIGIVGAGNDHRLGANEAPPAIISAYVGRELEKVVDGLIAGCAGPENCKSDAGSLNLGVSSLPSLTQDTADRNRTSPMAFTGNKFEFRALGGSQSVATINIAINTTVAKTLEDLSDAVETLAAEKKISGAEAARELLPKFLGDHRVALFNGDNYSADWVEEAARRGLPNLKNSVQALALYDTPEIISVFESQKVLSRPEVLARQHILLEDYLGRLLIEADLTRSLARTTILPAAIKWQERLAATAWQARELAGENEPELAAYKDLRALTNGLSLALDELAAAGARVGVCPGGPLEKAAEARDLLLPAMAKVRGLADQLETVVDGQLWPLPTYSDIFWTL